MIPSGSLLVSRRVSAAALLIVTAALLPNPIGVAQVPGSLTELRPKVPPVQTRQFDGLAEGPYNRLVLRNVMVVPGHGGPPTGPHDILIEGNVIREIRSFASASPAGGAQRWTGDRVIDGTGLYVMPGLIDLHHHTREEPIPLEYTY